MPSARSGDATTFLFTDIEGSTPLWEQSPDAMQGALEQHDRIIRAAAEGHSGVVFSSAGDGFAIAFDTAGDALRAGIAVQRSLQAESWPESTPIRVRMGLHTGAAQERDGDFFGTSVNRAARVMGAARGGQILSTVDTIEVAGVIEEAEFVDFGEQALKGLAQATRVYAVRASGLVWFEPTPAVRSVGRGALPIVSTEWVGSVSKLRETASTLGGVRLLTLTGPGGGGKTRTAIEIAQLAAGSFPDGIRFVDLGTLVDPGSVPAATATALRAQPQPGLSMIEAIVDWLEGREVLLVFDNCEHVIDAAADVIRQIMVTSRTTVLTTSREPLAIDGEHVEVLETMDSNDAIELFFDRAGAVGGAVADDESVRMAVAAICERLDRNPLAIELAAARSRSLAPADLLAHLDDRFRILAGSNRDGVERHRTLRAAVEWSYELLSESERVVFDRASVFAGGFDLDGATAVCAGGVVTTPDVLDAVVGLVDKSMLIADHTGASARYRLLQTMRDYAAGQLCASGEATIFETRFLEHELEVAERAHNIWLSPQQPLADRVFDNEWDNVREAFRHAIFLGDADTAARLIVATNPHAFCRLRHEHADWASMLLDLEDNAVILGVATRWAWAQLDHEALFELAARGMAACGPDDPSAAVARSFLAMAYLVTGRAAEATELADAIWRDVDGTLDPYTRILSLFPLALGNIGPAPIGDEGADGDHDVNAAVDRMREEAKRIGSPSLESAAAIFGVITLLSSPESDADETLTLLDDATEAADLVGDVLWEIQALNLAAQAAVRFGRLDAASRCAAVLERAVDSRFWVVVGQAIPAALVALSGSGREEAVATVVGGIERNFAIAHPLARELIDRVITDARADPVRAEFLAAGDRLERVELVRFMINELSAA